MSKVIVRYKVKPEFVDENNRLLQGVFAELNDGKPTGFRYATFVSEDGVTFFHVASVETDNNPLNNSAAFKEFRNEINDRCDEIPVPKQVNEVGSFNFFK